MYAISRMLTETTIDSVGNERLAGQTRLISSCDNGQTTDRLASLADFFFRARQIFSLFPCPRLHYHELMSRVYPVNTLFQNC